MNVKSYATMSVSTILSHSQPLRMPRDLLGNVKIWFCRFLAKFDQFWLLFEPFFLLKDSKYPACDQKLCYQVRFKNSLPFITIQDAKKSRNRLGHLNMMLQISSQFSSILVEFWPLSCPKRLKIPLIWSNVMLHQSMFLSVHRETIFLQTVRSSIQFAISSVLLQPVSSLNVSTSVLGLP